MPSIPLWLLGRDATTVTITVQSVNSSTGVLSDGTGTDIAALATAGVVDEIEFSSSKTLENIAPMYSLRAHYVPISLRYSFTITEVMRAGSNTCLLANVWHSATSSLVKFVFKRGGNTWTTYGVLTDYSESLQRGKNVARLTVGMVDVAPTYTTP